MPPAIPPTIGPTHQTGWATQVPLTSAGPKARAGFIAAPVSVPPTRMSKNSSQPDAEAADLRRVGETAVPNTADIRKKVSTASSIDAVQHDSSSWPATVCRGRRPATIPPGNTDLRAARQARRPTSWATT